MQRRQYLGNSVYVSFDGIALCLTANNPGDRIDLDRDAWKALEAYVRTMKDEDRAEWEREQTT